MISSLHVCMSRSLQRRQSTAMVLAGCLGKRKVVVHLTCTANKKKFRLKPVPASTYLLVTVIKIDEAQYAAIGNSGLLGVGAFGVNRGVVGRGGL